MQQYKHAQSSVGEGKPPVRSCDDGVAFGVHAGNVFEVYQIPEIEKTPLLPDVLGELKIVKTKKRTATAVIVQNNYDIHVGNKIRSKR